MGPTETLQVVVDLNCLAENRKVWRVGKNTVTRLHMLLRGLGFVALLTNYELKMDSAPPS